MLLETWNTVTSNWDNSFRSTSTYSGNNNTYNLNETWNTATSMWENSSDQTNTFDGNNRQTEGIYRYWNPVSMAWENSGKDIYGYNADDDQTYHEFQSWSGSNWMNTFREYFYYDIISGIVDHYQAEWIKVFPNPSSGAVNFSFIINPEDAITLEIFDLRGRMVNRVATNLQVGAGSRITWNGSDAAGNELPGGQYIYRLSSGDQFSSGMITIY